MSPSTVSISLPARSDISGESERPTKGKLFHIFDKMIEPYYTGFPSGDFTSKMKKQKPVFGLGGKLNMKGFNNLWM